MGFVLATTAGLVVWIVLWAIGAKAIDAFLVTVVIVVVALVVRITLPVPAGPRVLVAAPGYAPAAALPGRGALRRPRSLCCPVSERVLEEGLLRARGLAASGCLVTALAFGVAACGSDDNGDSSGGSGSTGSNSLTIYSSLPLQGDSRPQSQSVVNGEKLALEEASSKVGKFTIKYVEPRRRDRRPRASGSRARPRPTAARPRRTRARSPTSGSSTPAPRRSRCRSSTRPASCRSRRRTPRWA